MYNYIQNKYFISLKKTEIHVRTKRSQQCWLTALGHLETLRQYLWHDYDYSIINMESAVPLGLKFSQLTLCYVKIYAPCISKHSSGFHSHRSHLWSLPCFFFSYARISLLGLFNALTRVWKAVPKRILRFWVRENHIWSMRFGQLHGGRYTKWYIFQ